MPEPMTLTVKAVLKEFEHGGHYPDSPAPHTHWHDVDAMADEILRLRATLAQRREGVTEALDGWYLVERNRHVYQQATEEHGRKALDRLQKSGVTDIVLTRLAALAASGDSALGARDGGAA